MDLTGFKIPPRTPYKYVENCFPRYTKATLVFAIVLFTLFGFQNISLGQTATASWTLTSNGNSATAGNINASAITGGSGIGTVSYGTNGANASGWDSSNRDTEDYFEYSISPASGFDLTVSSISFDQFSSSNQNETGAVYYSTDGFVTYSQAGSDFTVPKSQNNTSINSLGISVSNGQILTIRIYAWGLKTNASLFYNQNVVISGTTVSVTSPYITTSPVEIDFGYVEENTTSSEISYEISGDYLNGTQIDIAAPADFEISLTSGTGFASSLSLSYSGNTLPATIVYCRFEPTLSNTDYSDVISHSGGGAAIQNLAVLGTTVVDCSDNAIAVYSSSGVDNPEFALGEADLNGAELFESGDELILDLTGDAALSSGGVVDVYWDCTSTNKSGQISIDLSEDGITWTTVGSYSVASGGWTSQSITLSVNTRYIRFASENKWDVLIDAIEFDPPPTISCPSDITATVDPGLCTASGIDLGTPITSDNCGIASVANNAPATYPLGSTTIIWTVTDIAGNTDTCLQNVTIVQEEEIDVEVVDLASFCQTGQSGTTSLSWNVNLLSGSTDWTYDYTINDGTTDVDLGTGVSASGNITISYSMTNESGDKTFTLTLTNVKDNCGSSEIDTTNNSVAVTVYAVPATGEIIPD